MDPTTSWLCHFCDGTKRRYILANRAYLFVDDLIHLPSVFEGGFANRQRHYDSRHNLPLGWMFLFSKDNLVPIHVEFQNSRWTEWKLAAPKAPAIQRLRDRIGHLKSWHLPNFDLEKEAFELAATLERWEGNHLFLDPEEIFSGCGLEDDSQEDFLRSLLDLLDSHSPCLGRIDPRELGPCGYSREPRDFHHHIMEFLGTTYAWDEPQ